MKWTDEQIKELCDNATPGPWALPLRAIGVPHKATYSSVPKRFAGVHTLPICRIEPSPWRDNDAKFIAAARELVPQLLERALMAEEAMGSFRERAQEAEKIAGALARHKEVMEEHLKPLQGYLSQLVGGYPCEYCEATDIIVGVADSGMTADIRMDVEDDGYPSLDLIVIEDSVLRVDDSVRINFCPFCGRKL